MCDIYFFITKSFIKKEQNLGSGEVIEPLWMNFEEVKNLCIKDGMKSSRDMGVLLKYVLKNS